MFPLSSPLLPYERLPLHVFEERYRVMIADCLAGERRFGVVLIARGSEVGGGDVRNETGTVAEIEVVSPTPDGRYGILATGTTQLIVKEWLADAPYPRALVQLRDEIENEDLSSEVAITLSELRALRELWAELGEGPALPDQVSLGASFSEQVWRLCSATPLGELDRQRLLDATTTQTRLELLQTLIREHHFDFATMLQQRRD
jgi:Lon protease-like protein